MVGARYGELWGAVSVPSRLIRLTVEASTPFFICANSAKEGGVALEHLFSKAGYIVSKLRAPLSPDNVN